MSRCPRDNHHAGSVDKINLVPICWATQRFKCKRIVAILIGKNRRQPVFVGKTDPAARLFRINLRNTAVGILDVVIILLTQRFIKDAKRAFMKNVDATNWGVP